MKRDIILANATLVLPDETFLGQLRIIDGRIAEIAEGAGVPKGAEDCGGDLVMPGLIELHTDNLERHIEPRPKVDWPHAAAIIAHIADFPTTFEAAQACKNHRIKVMMGAPNLIRGGSHSGNVAARDLAEADLLDIVSSDCVPSSLLSAALLLGELWGSIARGVSAVTAAPAKAVGLADRGEIRPEARADLVRVCRIGAAGAVRGVWVQGHRVA